MSCFSADGRARRRAFLFRKSSAAAFSAPRNENPAVILILITDHVGIIIIKGRRSNINDQININNSKTQITTKIYINAT